MYWLCVVDFFAQTEWLLRRDSDWTQNETARGLSDDQYMSLLAIKKNNSKTQLIC